MSFAHLNEELAKVKEQLTIVKDELKDLKEDKRRKDKQGMAQHLPFCIGSILWIGARDSKERFFRKLVKRQHDTNNAFEQMEEAIENNEAFATERGRLSQERQERLHGDTPSIEYNKIE